MPFPSLIFAPGCGSFPPILASEADSREKELAMGGHYIRNSSVAGNTTIATQNCGLVGVPVTQEVGTCIWSRLSSTLLPAEWLLPGGNAEKTHSLTTHNCSLAPHLIACRKSSLDRRCFLRSEALARVMQIGPGNRIGA